VNTPADISRRVVEVFRSDAAEMMRREQKRLTKLKPGRYVADGIGTAEERYRGYQDRAGEVTAHHTVGEGLEGPWGMVAAWVAIALNDIGMDYERDVLCGETNDFVRGLSGASRGTRRMAVVCAGHGSTGQ
jgi:hypothetical protein